MPELLLIAYDAERPADRQWVDRLQRWDRRGVLIAFPIQNAELLHLAPELAGLSLHTALHAVDCAARAVYVGREVRAEAYRRLGFWKALLFRISDLGNRSHRKG